MQRSISKRADKTKAPDNSTNLPERKGKPDSSGDKGQSFTFKTNDEADEVVNPLLAKVYVMRKRERRPTVRGWLNRLKMWLMRMERGNFKDQRTPLFKSLSYAQIAKLMKTIVNTDLAKKSSLYPLVPRFYGEDLVKAEEHQADKIGPRGCFPPASEWLDDKVEELWKDQLPNPDMDKSAYKLALQDISQAYKLAAKGKRNKITVRDFEQCFKDAGTERQTDQTLNSDTNSCYPTYVRRWYHAIITPAVTLVQKATQAILYAECKRMFIWALKQNSWRDIANKLHFVITANQRTNVADGHIKTERNTYRGHLMSKLRVTCAAEKMDTILGKPLLNMLIDVAKEIRNPNGTRVYVALTTPEQIDKNMQVILEDAHTAGRAVLSTDYSHFDESVSPWLAWDVACAVSEFMEFHTRNLYLALVYAETYQCRCITTTRIFPEGPSRRKSGTIFTNNCDSNENYVIQRYGYRAGFWGEPRSQVVNGDDALLDAENALPEPFEKAAAHLNMDANHEKQYQAMDSLAFCQLLHVRGYPGGVYPISRATAACVSLEDDVKIETDDSNEFPYVLSYRTVCRLNNACFNPNFVQLVQLYKREDRIQLGANMPAAKLASLAGSYAIKMEREKFEKPWKASGSKGGFEALPVNRVLRGELPPPPGIELWEWVRGVKYSSQEL